MTAIYNSDLLSLHSITRTMERKDCSFDAAVRFLTNGLKRGVSADAFIGRDRDFLLNHADRGCNTLAYNGFCLVVSESGCCVTAYELPSWFGKKEYFNGKDKVRKLKKYAKFQCDDRMYIPA